MYDLIDQSMSNSLQVLADVASSVTDNEQVDNKREIGTQTELCQNVSNLPIDTSLLSHDYVSRKQYDLLVNTFHDYYSRVQAPDQDERHDHCYSVAIAQNRELCTDCCNPGPSSAEVSSASVRVDQDIFEEVIEPENMQNKSEPNFLDADELNSTLDDVLGILGEQLLHGHGDVTCQVNDEDFDNLITYLASNDNHTTGANTSGPLNSPAAPSPVTNHERPSGTSNSAIPPKPISNHHHHHHHQRGRFDKRLPSTSNSIPPPPTRNIPVKMEPEIESVVVTRKSSRKKKKPRSLPPKVEPIKEENDVAAVRKKKIMKPNKSRMSSMNIECKWTGCGQWVRNDACLDEHITDCHVGCMKEDAWQCAWSLCANKPVFTRKSLLVNHIRSLHSLYRAFECSVCHKDFSTKERLIIHTRTHNGLKPYKCEFCAKCFASTGQKAKHQKAHLTTDKLICKFCDRTYSTRDALTKHTRLKHSA